MKYEKEVNEILEFLLRDPDMTDEEYKIHENKVLSLSGNTREKLNADFETGVSNGLSVSAQMEIIKTLKP